MNDDSNNGAAASNKIPNELLSETLCLKLVVMQKIAKKKKYETIVRKTAQPATHSHSPPLTSMAAQLWGDMRECSVKG